MGDPQQLIRIAEIVGGALVALIAIRQVVRYIGGAEERKLQKKLHDALDAGDLRRAGDIQLGRGLYREAARIYERAKEWARVARALVKLGDLKGAAGAHEKAKDFASAAPLYRQAEDWLHAGECYEKAGGEDNQVHAAECYAQAKQHLRAGAMFQTLGQYEKAADALSKADKIEPPDRVLLMLENAAMLTPDVDRKKTIWRRAGDEALKLGHHARAAQAFERGGSLERAATIYEEALHQPDMAAAIYEQLGNDAAAERLRRIAGTDAVARQRSLRAEARSETAVSVDGSSSPQGTVAGLARAKSNKPLPAPARPEDQRFELLGELGRGGMGIVYRARDKRLDRFIALKFLPPDLEADVGLLKVFRREARAAAVLTHPGIVTVYDVGTLDGREYIAMELVEGKTLDKVLIENGPPPLRKSLDIFDKVVDAVSAAHEKGVVHRDLKPGNIMLTRSGIKVMDFGLAKLTTGPRTSNQQTILGGTPGYMPPEQMIGTADHRADVFALGATFYELLTGKLPGMNGVPASLSTGYPSPHDLVSKVPEQLSAAIMSCLVHDMTLRTQDCATLQREIGTARTTLDAIEKELQAFLSESSK